MTYLGALYSNEYKGGERVTEMIRITIVYDNTAWNETFTPDWGFSCVIEAFGTTILFDTGAKGHILLDNMKKSNIDPMAINDVVISHAHWDHTGGLFHFLQINPVTVYIPYVCSISDYAGPVIRVKEYLNIRENIYSTGVLEKVEQSLAVKRGDDVIVIAGCSHPGVKNLITAASKFGKVRALIGGLHGFDDFNLINDLDIICPTHCTRFIQKIKTLYPEKYVEGGAGRVIHI